MNARAWLFAAPGRLRAPWRILIFLAATYACGFVASLFVAPAIAFLYSLVGLRVATDGWVVVAALLGGHFLALRYVDKRPWSDVWLDRAAARPALLARGFLFGALAIGVPTVLLIAIGWLALRPGVHESFLAAALRVSIFLLPAAFYEELATRGYIFAVLRDSIGWRTALIAMSCIFGLLHARNPGANVESVALVTLAGIFLGGVVIATRSLYAAWMAHFAWNWTMAVVFHTAVSGLPLEAPDYRYVDAGPDWATGGVWGPEGGAAAGLGMLGGLVYLYARRGSRRRESPDE
ncbi:MAG TPA: type II CAAX endopeptidase family protein [Gemmatimonadaceae bacterium]|nr:type II CAAX endopeptidase family protein [Gemmatimonadaceae bacterium]